MIEAKTYKVEGIEFEFTPDGSPFEGLLMVLPPEGRPFSSHVKLDKLGSRAVWAREAAELYGMDDARLKRALNELCTLRTEEVAAASEEAETVEEGRVNSPVSDEQIEELVGLIGVLDRYVEDAAAIRGAVGERPVLKLQTLIAFGAQLSPYPNGKPAGANLIITAEAGRGKNHVCDAVAAPLPEEFCLAFESASAKSLFYKAEHDPAILKHLWVYPNEGEATDQLVELFRPLLSGKASP